MERPPEASARFKASVLRRSLFFIPKVANLGIEELLNRAMKKKR